MCVCPCVHMCVFLANSVTEEAGESSGDFQRVAKLESRMMALEAVIEVM